MIYRCQVHNVNHDAPECPICRMEALIGSPARKPRPLGRGGSAGNHGVRCAVAEEMVMPSEPLKIHRVEYEQVRTAWVSMEINQPKFAEMFKPLGEAHRLFPCHDPSPAAFLRKHVERKTKIRGAQRDYDSEKERLGKIFDDCARDSGVVIVEE
jgi:hypothetical protein